MHTRHLRRQAAQVVAGTVLVAVGILFLGQQLHLWEGWSFKRLWPLVPIIVGISHVVVPKHPQARISGVVLVGSSAVLLLHTTRIVSLQQSWPLFLVIGGVATMLKGVVRRRSDGCARSNSYGL